MTDHLTELIESLDERWITTMTQACHIAYKTIKDEPEDDETRGRWLKNKTKRVERRNKEICEKAYHLGHKEGMAAAAEKLTEATKKIMDLEATVAVLKAAQTRALTNVTLPPPQLQQARKA